MTRYPPSLFIFLLHALTDRPALEKALAGVVCRRFFRRAQ
jgi:hypothetical protein